MRRSARLACREEAHIADVSPEDAKHTGVTNDREAAWFQCDTYAVVGASKDRNKFGNKCFRALMKHMGGGNGNGNDGDGVVIPVHHTASSIEGVSAVTLDKLLGFVHLWLQPGAESAEVFAIAAHAGATLIAGGPCVLVALGEPDSF
eukprot:gene15005-17391_t